MRYGCRRSTPSIHLSQISTSSTKLRERTKKLLRFDGGHSDVWSGVDESCGGEAGLPSTFPDALSLFRGYQGSVVAADVLSPQMRQRTLCSIQPHGQYLDSLASSTPRSSQSSGLILPPRSSLPCKLRFPRHRLHSYSF